MIKSKKLVTEYRKQFGRTYQQMDCIHSIANILYRYGGKSQLTGSNWYARHEIKNLRPLTDRSQLYDGCAVLKTKMPNESGYALPDRYKSDDVRIDYNHIGLGCDDGTILDSTTIKDGKGGYLRNGPGISTSPISAAGWDVIGEFEDVDYSDKTVPVVIETPDTASMPLDRAALMDELSTLTARINAIILALRT